MLVVGAFYNPNNDLKLIAKERNSFQDHIGPLDSSENFDYEIFEDKEMGALIKSINKRRDIIVWFHFSGHHDEKGIRLNDGKSFTSLVDELLTCKKLKGVFINGCASKSTLDKLAEKVPICIGTFEPIYDTIAEEFSDLFYQKMDSIEKWEDYDAIHQEFDLSLANLVDIVTLEKHKDSRIARGGGSVEDIEKSKDYYFISPKSDSSRETFNLIDDDKIIRDNPNQKLVEILDKLNIEDGSAANKDRALSIKKVSANKYIKKSPLIFTDILTAFLIDSNTKFHGIGDDRSNLIKHYFYAFLNIYRYSILSLLWDLSNNDLNADKFVTDITVFSEVEIEMLNKDLNKLTSNAEGQRLNYIKDLLASEGILKEGTSIFMNESKDYVHIEKYFYRLLAATNFLNSYQFRSIYSRNYIKNRIDEEKYSVKYVHDITKKAVDYSKNEKISYDCIYSIYICDKNLDSTIVNLSPFYFDKNFIETERKKDDTSAKIDLYVLKEKDDCFTEGVKFDYLSTYKPLKGTNVEILSLIKLSEDQDITMIEKDNDGVSPNYSADKSYILESVFKELTSIIT